MKEEEESCPLPGSSVRNLQIEIHPSFSLFSLLSSLVARSWPPARPSLGRWLLMQRARSARPTLKNGRPAMIQSFARTGRYRVGGRTLRRKYSTKQVAEFTSRPRSEHLSRPTFPSIVSRRIWICSILWAIFEGTSRVFKTCDRSGTELGPNLGLLSGPDNVITWDLKRETLIWLMGKRS